MLPDDFTIDFIDAADDVTTISKTYVRRNSNIDGTVEYKEQGTRLDPSLPIDSIIFKVADAAPSAAFYGTRRISLVRRFEKMLATPTGERLLPFVVKPSFSIPIGFDAVFCKNELRLMEKLHADTAMLNAVVYGDS